MNTMAMLHFVIVKHKYNFWTGWKQEAINIIIELLNDKK